MIAPSFNKPRQFFVYFLRPHWRKLLIVMILLLIEAGLVALQPLVIAPIVSVAVDEVNVFQTDTVASDQLNLGDLNLNNIDLFISELLNLGSLAPWDIVLLLCGIFAGLIILRAAVEVVSFYLFTWVYINSLRSLQSFVFGHLLTLSLNYFNVQRSGEIVSRIERDTTNAASNLRSVVRILATAPVMIIFYGILLIRTDVVLMLLVSLIAGLQWVAARLLRTRLRSLVRDEFDLIADVNAYLHEIFQNIRVVKSFVAERFEALNLRKKVDAMIPVHINRALYRHWHEPIVLMINGITNVAILLLSTNRLFNGDLTIPGFFLFLYLGRSIISPLSQLGQVYLSVQEMEASAERVFDMVQSKSTIENGPRRKKDFEEAVRFKNVSFSYGDEDVLRDVDIEIHRGQMVALVGPSGAGKSTLTDLLLRFYDPTSGEISVDDIPLKELNVDDYRRLFGVVAQENLLFNATIAENITYGRNGITREEIKRAAEVANAARFIEKTPDGYETMVGDRGIRLSGGQRQRVAIARAIVHQPEILILDEATSSLDTQSERMVQAAIDRVIRNTTAVVVAHRLSTVIHADKIIVLEKGRILDQGKHEELIKRCQLYRRLCELQFGINGD